MTSFENRDGFVSTQTILEAESRGALKALREGAASGLLDEEDSCHFRVLYFIARVCNPKAAFNHPNAIHAVAVKTNPHRRCSGPRVWGFGLEAASFEELLLAKSAGIAPEKLVFDGPVKTAKEIIK